MTVDDGFLTKNGIEESKKVALEDYDVKLTDEQALEYGIALVSFFEHLMEERIKK